MFESLFGAEMPLAVRFFVAFLIVLGLIGAIAWAVRRFGSGRLGASTRGRQPRLAVIDYASVDGRRRLILVRRDNVEHLLMIGGPSDIVVEPNIVRAVPAARDIGRPPAGIEALTRTIPLPENGGSWPLQPEANGGSRPAARNDSPPEDLPGRLRRTHFGSQAVFKEVATWRPADFRRFQIGVLPNGKVSFVLNVNLQPGIFTSYTKPVPVSANTLQ